MDLDNFKCVVDTHSHLRDSRVIQEAALAQAQKIR